MSKTNGHSISKTHAQLFKLALEAGITPSWRGIADAAGVSVATVLRGFCHPGASPNAATFQYVAEALKVDTGELRRLHAALQLEEPTPEAKPAKPVQSTPKEPDGPRDFWAELIQHAVDGSVVIVAANDPEKGRSIARGHVVGMHSGWIAVQPTGDSRPARMRVESITEVRKAPAA